MPRGRGMGPCRDMRNRRSPSSNGPTFDYGTDELQTLFEDWLSQLLDEVEQYIEDGGQRDAPAVADKFGISEESAMVILAKGAG